MKISKTVHFQLAEMYILRLAFTAFKNRRYRLAKYSKQEVEEFDKKHFKDELDYNHYLLKGRKWWLIENTYYEVPKPVRFTWFRNLKTVYQVGICVLAAGLVGTAIGVPLYVTSLPRAVELDNSLKGKIKLQTSKDSEGNNYIKIIPVEEKTDIYDLKVFVGDYEVKDPVNEMDYNNDTITLKANTLDSHSGAVKLNGEVKKFTENSKFKFKFYNELPGTSAHYAIYYSGTEEERKQYSTDELVIPSYYDGVDDMGYNNGKYPVTTFYFDNTYTAGGFSCCGQMKKVYLPNTINCLTNNSFGDSKIEEIYLSPYTINYSSDTFTWCENLKSISCINEGTTKLSEGQFSSSSIKSITLPTSLEMIGGSCFEGCDKLEKVNFLDRNSSWILTRYNAEDKTINISELSDSEIVTYLTKPFSNGGYSDYTWTKKKELVINGDRMINSSDTSKECTFTLSTKNKEAKNVKWNLENFGASIENDGVAKCTGIKIVKSNDKECTVRIDGNTGGLFTLTARDENYQYDNFVFSVGSYDYIDFTDLEAIKLKNVENLPDGSLNLVIPSHYYNETTKTFDEIKKIAKYGFSAESSNNGLGLKLKSVTFSGKSSIKILEGAFSGDVNLESVGYSNCFGTTDVGDESFKNCSKLSNFTFMRLVYPTSKSKNIFAGCSSLNTLIFKRKTARFINDTSFGTTIKNIYTDNVLPGIQTIKEGDDSYISTNYIKSSYSNGMTHWVKR